MTRCGGEVLNRVATGEQAPRPAHEPGTITDAPPLSPELTDESGRVVELKTAPADRRFPFGNQTRHCYARYLEYHWCVKATGGESAECEKFARYYRSLCPTDWIMEWNRQRELGIFPGPI
ncbi:Cytochrome c oxidase subunit 6b [Rhynchospora pubera]|uniref:Cytochrome c oxidase subunit 6b n=1 Tax=Rhynchospora pubera TaxID=906938 RepID=A0AAV8FID3_9POAL|nr:Cytochrome c oxidase subunit 6b [Rhynchospora pubera]